MELRALLLLDWLTELEELLLTLTVLLREAAPLALTLLERLLLGDTDQERVPELLPLGAREGEEEELLERVPLLLWLLLREVLADTELLRVGSTVVAAAELLTL